MKSLRTSRSQAMAVFANIRRRREALDLTLEIVAERAGLTPNYVGSIENGYRDPSLSTLRALAKALDIPLGELLGPTQPLSTDAVDMAQLFEGASRAMQNAILAILRAATKPQRP